MGNILRNLKQVWLAAGMSHRLTLLGIGAGFLVVVGVLVFWASRPEFALLYGQLTAEEAGEIAEKLREQGVKYELRDHGRTVMVPVDKVYGLRLSLVSDGVLESSSQGYSILDDDGLGVSPFKERVNYIRAISGELEKTIALINGVTGARVHIVSEDGSVLRRSQKESSASVFIKTNGASLRQDNVVAVANLVAGAVKGLSPDQVKVIVNGKTQWGDMQDEMTGTTNSLLEYKIKIEKYLSGKAEDMLAHVLGEGRATVKVNATVSTKEISRTRKLVDPENRVSIKEETTKENSSGAGRGNSSPASQTKNSSEVIEYVEGMEMEQTIDRPGKIESLAVSVFVDLSLVGKTAGGEGGSGGEGGEPSTEQQKTLTVQHIKDAVQNALGLQDGSAITVVDVPFANPPEIEQGEEAGLFGSINTDFMLEIINRSSLAVVVMGMLVAFRFARGKKNKKGAAEEPQSVAQALSSSGGKSAAQSRQIKGADKALRQRIITSLQSNPEEVKKMFLSWVESDANK